MKHDLSSICTNTNIEQQTIVLTKALRNTADRLALTQRGLGLVIGFSEASSSRFYRGEKQISPETKEGEIALILIRIFRSLSAVLGGDILKCQQWFNAYNKHLNGIPAEMITHVEGLSNVACYLDVMRGKL